MTKWVTRARALRRLRRILKEVRPDILHAGPASTAGLLAAASGFHPFVLMPWGSDVLLFPSRSRVSRRVVKFVSRRADAITPNSAHIAVVLAAMCGVPAERFLVVPRSADLELFHPSDDLRRQIRSKNDWQDSVVVLMARSFKPLYAVEDFVLSMSDVYRRIPKARFVLAGSGPLEETLRQLVARQGLAELVEFLGPVPHEDMPGLLNAADLYVSTSLSDGASNALIESLACGRAVVVTDLPSNREWVTDGLNGRLVPIHSPGKLAQAIWEVLENHSLRESMERRAVALTELRANLRINSAQWISLYEKLVEARQAT